MDTKIRVENVGYYHCDRDLSANLVSDELTQLKTLNGYSEYLNHSIRKLPNCKLNTKIPTPEFSESQMESFLDYIGQNGFGNQKPNFVTSKDLLKSVTSLETHLIHVCKVGGVIFVLKMDKENAMESKNQLIFNHLMTKKSENEPIRNDSIQKGVWKAEILNGGKKEYSILYSGKVDAIQKTKMGKSRNYELEVAFGGTETDAFWWEKSCKLFWKSFFGASPSIIIASRTGEFAFKRKISDILVTYPKNSIYEIKELSRDEMPSLAAPNNQRPLWTVSDGKKNLYNFLKLVKSHVKRDGDCFVISRIPGSQKWNFKQDTVSVGTFREAIQRSISNLYN
ncbi:hypothetical protein B9Z55_003136 [Caenorhabditis nigoni]|uniref:Decapping nuclease n=1 Tax=Caenorhabditis nigoni TaxID=1611254 RepID=A0A2G5VNN4_9PELO|nr:hypothetical protein B9Z55_003136 [Caenorhabditis nigoni]